MLNTVPVYATTTSDISMEAVREVNIYLGESVKSSSDTISTGGTNFSVYAANESFSYPVTVVFKNETTGQKFLNITLKTMNSFDTEWRVSKTISNVPAGRYRLYLYCESPAPKGCEAHGYFSW